MAQDNYIPPVIPTQPSPVLPAPPAEIKQSPFRFLLPILGILLILGAGWLVVSRFTSLTGSKSAAPQTLTYWGLWEPNAVLNSVLADFAAQNPGITVKYEQQKSQDYRQRLQTALASGNGPDLFRFHQTWVPMIQADLAAVPKSVLSDAAFQSTYYPVAGDWLKSSRGYLGLPLEIDGLGLFYNKTIFAAAGLVPPKNWIELTTVAQQLTVSLGDQIQRGGIALGTTTNVDHWSDILGFMLLQNDADPSKPNNKYGQDTLTYYTKFVTYYKVWDATMPPSTYAFATGKAAMMIAPSWEAFTVHNDNPNLDFAIAPIPQLPDTNINWASFWVEGVSAHSPSSKQAAAWKLLQFLSTKETLRKLYAAEASVRLFGEPFPRVDMADQLTSDPYAGAIINSAPTMKSWYLCSDTFDNGLNDEMIKYYEDALNTISQNTPVDQALTTTEKGITQVSAKYHL